MLTITKKAATADECDALLTASYAVNAPFGIPTLIINPLTFIDTASRLIEKTGHFKMLLQNRIEGKIRDAVNKTLSTDTPPFLNKAAPFSFSQSALTKIISTKILSQTDNSNDTLISTCLPNAEPNINIILHSPAENSLSYMLKNLELANGHSVPSLPGFSSQHSFCDLWHEIAHGVTGADEAGADYISALVCRHAFDDCNFLTVQADLRAIEAVIKFDQVDTVVEKYGWPCVEAIDTALSTPAPSWGDIEDAVKTFGDRPCLFRKDSITHVGEAIYVQSEKHPINQPLSTLADIAEDFLIAGVFRNAEQTMIAERFALAARRLSIGTPAYKTPQNATIDWQP